jgi:hypothetical protein
MSSAHLHRPAAAPSARYTADRPAAAPCPPVPAPTGSATAPTPDDPATCPRSAPRRRRASGAGTRPAATTGPPALTGRHWRLARNVTGNAIRHNIPGGQVSIRSPPRARPPRLEITNTGPVIPVGEVTRAAPAVPAAASHSARHRQGPRPGPVHRHRHSQSPPHHPRHRLRRAHAAIRARLLMPRLSDQRAIQRTVGTTGRRAYSAIGLLRAPK